MPGADFTVYKTANDEDLVLFDEDYPDEDKAIFLNALIGDAENRKNHYRKSLINILKNHGCRRILDAGCGTGIDSIWLIEEGFKVGKFFCKI